MYVSDLPAWALRAFAFAFGALWGSFFNVAIHRWPRDMSVVTPPSHCPHCKTAIPAWRNIPVFGYIALRGRAACCGAKLTPRYFLVELIAGCLGLALAERYMIDAPALASLSDTAITTLLFFAFTGGLVIATFVDLEWMEIPDEVSIGGTALGLATVTFREVGPEPIDVLIGAGGAYLMVQLLLVWSWERLTGRAGMGEGDSKLLMFIGAFVGWRGALFALVGGAVQGLIVSGVVLATGGRIGPSIESDSESEPEGTPGAPSRPTEDVVLLDAPQARHSGRAEGVDPPGGSRREAPSGGPARPPAPRSGAAGEARQQNSEDLLTEPDRRASATRSPLDATPATDDSSSESETATDDSETATDDSETATDDSEAVSASGTDGETFRLRDGTTVTRSEKGARLRVADRHGRALWEYLVIEEDEATARRKVPFGPFLALAALEYLFFGERLFELYFGLFE